MHDLAVRVIYAHPTSLQFGSRRLRQSDGWLR